MNDKHTPCSRLAILLFSLFCCSASLVVGATNVTFVKTLSDGEVVSMTEAVVGTTGSYDIVEYVITLSNGTSRAEVLAERLHVSENDPDLDDAPQDLVLYDALMHTTNLYLLHRTTWVTITEVNEINPSDWVVLSRTNLVDLTGSLTSFPATATLQTNATGQLEAFWTLPFSSSTSRWVFVNGEWMGE